MDFDYCRRDEIYDYLINKYGAENCSKIGTYNGFKARAAVRSTAKALDIGDDWDAFQRAKKAHPGKKIEPTKNSLNFADRISKTISFPGPHRFPPENCRLW